MPYTKVSDLPDYVPADKATQWMAVFNNAYAKAVAGGMSKDDAEQSAFKQANGVAGPNAKGGSMLRETRMFVIGDLKVEKRADDAAGAMVVAGYAATYNRPTIIRGWDNFKEIIKPGAFKRSVENKDDVRFLRNHDPNFVLGRTKSGTLALREDEKGLYFEVSLPDTSMGREMYTSVQRGDMDECSFAFTVPEDGDVWSKEKDASGNTLAVRELLDVDLFDVSVVTMPAYPGTSADTKAAEMPSELRAKADAVRAKPDDTDPGLAPEKSGKDKTDDTEAPDASDDYDDSMEYSATPLAAGALTGCGYGSGTGDCTSSTCPCQNRPAEGRPRAEMIAYASKVVWPEPAKREGDDDDSDLVASDDWDDDAIASPTDNDTVKAAKKAYKDTKDAIKSAYKDAKDAAKQVKDDAKDSAKAMKAAAKDRYAAAKDAAKKALQTVCDTQAAMQDAADAAQKAKDDAQKGRSGTEGAGAEGRATLTKSVGGKDLPASAFAYVGDPQKTETWKLPVHDAAHARNALARFNQTDLPADKKAAVWAKIVRAAKKFGIAVDESKSAEQIGQEIRDADAAALAAAEAARVAAVAADVLARIKAEDEAKAAKAALALLAMHEKYQALLANEAAVTV